MNFSLSGLVLPTNLFGANEFELGLYYCESKKYKNRPLLWKHIGLELTAQNQLPLARLLVNSGTSLSLLGAVGRSWKDLVKSENYERINTSTETFT
jgi:hypothetical protein